ncbi:surface-adhesin E family protein [Phenylobacterium sp.]|uniref:surface-adhesin E family protein n=1 Tax=Phenylobacterium sp. TaxID=1871053 RepID=UPI00301B78F0
MRSAALVVLATTLVAGCDSPNTAPPAKQAAPPPPVVEPRWRELRSNDERAVYFTPAVETVGPYKRMWMAEVLAKAKPMTVGGERILVERRSDLIEVDCAQKRVRSLQVNVAGEGGRTASDTFKEPQWYFVNPDAANYATLEHACGGRQISEGAGFSTLKAAMEAYRRHLASRAGGTPG